MAVMGPAALLTVGAAHISDAQSGGIYQATRAEITSLRLTSQLE